MQVIVLTGPLRGTAELTCPDGRLAVEWRPSRDLADPNPAEGEPEGYRIALRRRDGTVAGYALVDFQDAHLDRHRWNMNRGGYAVRSEGGRPILMHRVIASAPPGLEVDHINRNRLDNRRCNLRLTDHTGNMRNCSRNRRNTSGYKGVRRLGNRWAARLKCDGEWCCLGWFNTPEEAAVAYDLMAMALFGEFAATNFRYREYLDRESILRQLVAETAKILCVD